MKKIKNDKYKSKRGGHSRLLEISCRKCENHILVYQKDGPGNLRRMYIDRIFEPERLNKNQYKKIKDIKPLVCSNCKELLAVPYTYKPEQRLAYKVFVDAFVKKVISVKNYKKKHTAK